MKVSIIIPVYNAAAHLKKCVDSVLTQTYHDMEILLINDGSKDESGRICDEYATKDGRVRAIHKKNAGVSDTRNVRLNNANGDYILFVDSDDYIDSEMVECLLRRALEDGSDIVMCRYSVDRTGVIEPVDMQYNSVYQGSEKVKEGLLQLYYSNYHTGLYCLWNKLIKKSVYSNEGIFFDTSLKRGEDAWFIFQCLKRCSRVDYIDQSYYYYYQNDNSVMHTLYADQYEKWVEMRKRLLRENENLGFEIDFNSFYMEFLYKTVVYCRDLVSLGKIEEVNSIINDSMFRGALRYAKYLPVHIRVLLHICRYSSKIYVFGLRLWARTG